jgi:hypothetical protein
MMLQHNEVKRIKDFHTRTILAKPNVIGVGMGYKERSGQRSDELCVVALVRQKIPKAGLTPEALVPREIDQVRTDVVEVGDIRALQAPTERWRPAPGGVSIGHYQITAGTLGAVVRDRATGDRLILSNNHVLANSNDANLGDPILQPGPADGGQARRDTIAHLERFCPLEFSTDIGDCSLANAYAEIGNAIARLLGSKHQVQTLKADPMAVNLVDAALARPVNDEDILDEILEIGDVTGTVAAELGMAVRKSGRTTGFTTGEVTVLDATVNVSYGVGKVATFEGQIVTGPMSEGGDSGSLLVSGETLQAVGLLFAGSNQSTIHNPIQAVLDCLAIEI